jgi:hypothetical protein
LADDSRSQGFTDIAQRVVEALGRGAGSKGPSISIVD